MALGPWRGTRLRQTKYNRVDFRLPGETVASSSMVQVGSDFARATELSGIGSAQEFMRIEALVAEAAVERRGDEMLD